MTDRKILLAQNPDPFGRFNPPSEIKQYDILSGGIGKFLQLSLRTIIVIAGIYALINLVLAGYAFMSAGDDPKKIEAAWGKIWQTLLGLAVSAGGFVLAAIFGWLIFGDPNFIISPVIPTIN